MSKEFEIETMKQVALTSCGSFVVMHSLKPLCTKMKTRHSHQVFILHYFKIINRRVESNNSTDSEKNQSDFYLDDRGVLVFFSVLFFFDLFSYYSEIPNSGSELTMRSRSSFQCMRARCYCAHWAIEQDWENEWRRMFKKKLLALRACPNSKSSTF